MLLASQPAPLEQPATGAQPGPSGDGRLELFWGQRIAILPGGGSQPGPAAELGRGAVAGHSVPVLRHPRR